MMPQLSKSRVMQSGQPRSTFCGAQAALLEKRSGAALNEDYVFTRLRLECEATAFIATF